jgi:hypothetical protein
MYEACRPQTAQVRLMRSDRGAGSPGGAGRRRGTRWMLRVQHDGHTNGWCARSAAMSASASGARNSLIPRRPTTDSPPAVESSRVGKGGNGLARAYLSRQPEVAHRPPRL